jgi:hypothetical protein
MWPVAFALGAGTALVFKKMLRKASEGASEDIADIREKFRSENVSDLATQVHELKEQLARIEEAIKKKAD